MSERPRVLLALSPRVEGAVERLLFDEQAPLLLVASALDAAELERLARETNADTALLSADLPGLSSAVCARVRSGGLPLVGIALDDGSADALAAFGVDTVIEATADGEELSHALAAGTGNVRAVRPAASGLASFASAADAPANVVAVVGTRGAPGATECAASLATLAHERWPTALVECDLLGGGLDLRLAADAHAGSLLGLVRACAAGDPAVDELLERWLVRRPGWPAVLLAPPRPVETLRELAKPGAIATAVRALAAAFPLVVCDVGFLLDEGGDVTAVARAHREAVACAGAIIVVVGARERQLRDALAQLDLLTVDLEVPASRIRVVSNGLGARGTPPRRAVVATLTEHLAERGLVLDAALPVDGRGLRRVERRGCPLAGARQRGRYARTLRRLLDDVVTAADVADYDDALELEGSGVAVLAQEAPVT